MSGSRLAYPPGGSGGSSVPKVGCRAFNNANVAITSSTLTAIALNSEVYDYGSCHSTVTNNSRLTATTAGIYIITGCVEWGSSAVGGRQLYLKINGTTYISEVFIPSSASTVIAQNVTTLYEMALNDYVELIVFQDSGGNLNAVNGLNASPYLEFQLINT